MIYTNLSQTCNFRVLFRIIDLMIKKSVTTAEKIEALRQSVYFHRLSDDLLIGISQGMHLYSYRPAEMICWQGEECSGLHIIRKGSVKLFKLSPKGRELILRVLEERTTFNEVPVFDSGVNVMNAAALEESEIWLIDQFILRHALSENPELAQAVILNLSENLRMLVKMVEELSFHQVTNRLARLIFQLSPEQLHGQTSQRVTQDQLAARLGTVREVVARSLRELERSGAIRVYRRQIHVTDSLVLAAWAYEPPVN